MLLPVSRLLPKSHVSGCMTPFHDGIIAADTCFVQASWQLVYQLIATRSKLAIVKNKIFATSPRNTTSTSISHLSAPSLSRPPPLYTTLHRSVLHSRHLSFHANATSIELVSSSNLESRQSKVMLQHIHHNNRTVSWCQDSSTP